MSTEAFRLLGIIELQTGKMQSGLRTASNQVSNFARHTQNQIKAVESAWSRFSNSNFSQGFLGGFGLQRGSGLDALAGGAAANLLGGAIQQGTDKMRDLTARGMEYYDTVRLTTFAFKNLLGNQEKAKKHVADLLEFARQTPFDDVPVIQYAQSLESVGVQAEYVTTALRGIGNALVGSGQWGLAQQQGVMTGFQQLLGSPTLRTEEVTRQIRNYIPTIMTDWSKALGISIEEFRKGMEAGSIKSMPAFELLIDHYNKTRKGGLEFAGEKTSRGLISSKRSAEDRAFANMIAGGDVMDPRDTGPGAEYLRNLAEQIKRRDEFAKPGDLQNALGELATAYLKARDKDDEILFALTRNSASGGVGSVATKTATKVSENMAAPPGFFLGQSIGEWIAPGWKGVPGAEKLNPSWEDLGGGISNLAGWAKSLFTGATASAIDSVEQGQAPMKEAGASLGDSAIQGMKSEKGLDSNSPSKRAIAEGINVRQGLAAGLLDSSVDIKSAGVGLANEIFAGLHEGLSDNLIEKFLGRIEGKITKTKERSMGALVKLMQREPEFVPTIQRESAKRGMNPDHVLNMLAIESTFNKNIFNRWGYGGLGQIGRNERRQIGLPYEDAEAKRLFEGKSATWQLLNAVFPFIDVKAKANGPLTTMDRLYAAWGSGHAGRTPGYVHAEQGGKRAGMYANNPLWDWNKDGRIQQWEFGPAAETKLGAGVNFTVNGSSAVTTTNPMPVVILGGTIPSPPQEKRRSSVLDASVQPTRTINDPIPVNVDVVAKAEILSTSFVALSEQALMLRKPLDLLGGSAQTAADSLTATADGLTEAQIEAKRREALGAGQKENERAKVRWEGIADSFENALLNSTGEALQGRLGDAFRGFFIGLSYDIAQQFNAAFAARLSKSLFDFDGETATGGLTGKLLNKIGLGSLLSKVGLQAPKTPKTAAEAIANIRNQPLATSNVMATSLGSATGGGTQSTVDAILKRRKRGTMPESGPPEGFRSTGQETRERVVNKIDQATDEINSAVQNQTAQLNAQMQASADRIVDGLTPRQQGFLQGLLGAALAGAASGAAGAAVGGLFDGATGPRTASGEPSTSSRVIDPSTGEVLPNPTRPRRVTRRALGGIIHGPGGPTDDRILGVDRNTRQPTAWVSSGEFIINAAATKRNRALLETINREGRTREMPRLGLGGFLFPMKGVFSKQGNPATRIMFPASSLWQEKGAQRFAGFLPMLNKGYREAAFPMLAPLMNRGGQTQQGGGSRPIVYNMAVHVHTPDAQGIKKSRGQIERQFAQSLRRVSSR